MSSSRRIRANATALLALALALAAARAAEARAHSQLVARSANRRMGGHVAPAAADQQQQQQLYPGFPADGGRQFAAQAHRPLEVAPYAHIAPRVASATPSVSGRGNSAAPMMPTLYDEANGHYWEIANQPRDLDGAMGYGPGNVPGVMRETP